MAIQTLLHYRPRTGMTSKTELAVDDVAVVEGNASSLATGILTAGARGKWY